MVSIEQMKILVSTKSNFYVDKKGFKIAISAKEISTKEIELCFEVLSLENGNILSQDKQVVPNIVTATRRATKLIALF